METCIIIWIIIGTGLFGGIINYYRNIYENRVILGKTIKPILVGLAASALVPLFLNTISSDLLTDVTNLPVNYFVFLGFCLIASIYSGEFIDSIGKKVLNQIGEVKKEIEENNTEDDTTGRIDLSTNNTLSEDQKKIISAFIDNKFTYRSITGLSKQTNLDKVTIQKELAELGKLGLVQGVERQKGLRWRVTSEGYKK